MPTFKIRTSLSEISKFSGAKQLKTAAITMVYTQNYQITTDTGSNFRLRNPRYASLLTKKHQVNRENEKKREREVLYGNEDVKAGRREGWESSVWTRYLPVESKPTMADKAITIRIRKFMTNCLLSRKQFESSSIISSFLHLAFN